jgi:FkbM family methyltransferase
VAVPLAGGFVLVDLRELSSHALFAGLAPEESERALVERALGPGQVAFDIGAHWGIYTLLLALRVGPRGRVFAFEPCPAVLPCLKRTVESLPNVTLLPVAVSDRARQASLVVPPDASMASLVDWTDAGGRLSRHPIETALIDDLLRNGSVLPADFVKCDVEGAEALVFRGARTLLDRADAPVVMLEVNPRASAAFGLNPSAALDVLAGFDAAQYGFYSLERTGRLAPLSSPPERAWNVFAVPAGRREWLEVNAGHPRPAA